MNHFASKLAILVDREKLATLRGERSVNARVNKLLYWLEQARAAGAHLPELIEEALGSYADNPAHRALIKATLLHNHRIMAELGGYSPANQELLRHGQSATAGRGLYAGQKLEIDHIISIRHAPQLACDLANLEPMPLSLNRRKREYVSQRQADLARKLEYAGRLPAGCADTIKSLFLDGTIGHAFAAAGLSRPSMGTSARPAPMPQAALFSDEQADPERIIPRILAITERMQDWDRRAAATDEASHYVKRHATELVDCARRQLSIVLHQAEEETGAARRLAEEVARWHERWADSRRSAGEALAVAQAAARDSTAAEAFWVAQLSAARAWLSRAAAAEEQARAELRQAEWALASAESSLSQARSELEAAQYRTEYAGRNRDGTAIYRQIDTTPYRESVARAENIVWQCRGAVEHARHVLEAAIAERRRAERRVSACEAALSHAQAAAAAARLAAEAAGWSLTSVDRAREEWERAAAHAKAASAQADKGLAAAEQMKTHLEAAQRSDAEAQSTAHQAAAAYSEAGSRSVQGRLEMEWRIEQLRAFDAPLSFF